VWALWPASYGSARPVTVAGSPPGEYLALRVTSATQARQLLSRLGGLDQALAGWQAIPQADGDLVATAARQTVARTAGKAAADAFVPPASIEVPDNEYGASTGLVHVLAALAAGDPAGSLSGGRVVAATGEVDASGRVSGVGGVDDKAVAARDAGADVLFVPARQASDALAALGADTGGMAVVGVRRAADAVGYLCASGGRSRFCPPGP
jgi:hypothetical protein